MSQFQLSSLALSHGAYANFTTNYLLPEDHAAECVGTNLAWVERATTRFGVAAADLVSPAFKMAVVGLPDPSTSVSGFAAWPLMREANGIDITYSFADEVHQAIEDTAQLFSLPVNGVDIGEERKARAFVFGLAKAAAFSAMGAAARNETFLTGNTVPDGTFLLEIAPQAFGASVAQVGVPASNVGRLRLVANGNSPIGHAAPVPGITEATTMIELVDHMQSGPYRAKQKPQLLLSTVRIFLHAVGLMPSSTVSDLRSVLSACVGIGGTLQAMVTDRSEVYGATHRLPPAFKDLATTGAECLQILHDEPHRHIPLGPVQRAERETRWSLWVRYLNSIVSDAGTLPAIDWVHPQA